MTSAQTRLSVSGVCIFPPPPVDADTAAQRKAVRQQVPVPHKCSFQQVLFRTTRNPTDQTVGDFKHQNPHFSLPVSTHSRYHSRKQLGDEFLVRMPPRQSKMSLSVMLGLTWMVFSTNSFSIPVPHSLQSSTRRVPLSTRQKLPPTRSSLQSLHMSAKQDETLLNNTSVAPLFKPGAGPTVLLDNIDESDVYRQAIQRTLAWVAGAGLFGGLVWAIAGATTGEEFFAGYLVEQSLSVDNLFVFLVLFDYFDVPLANQDRVLNWGIYGAIVMRAIMIALGAAALENFHAILLVFAGILVYSSAQVLIGGEEEGEEEDMSQNTIVQFSKKLIDSTDQYDGDRFFTVVNGIRKATPLFICMIAVEISDVVFAVDSIPAVFGVTENPLVVFSSNMFAIMGLRSLYTILSKAATDLKYLEPAVAVVLGFIGAKMILEFFGYTIPTEAALGLVLTCLGTGIGLSVREKQQQLLQEGEED